MVLVLVQNWRPYGSGSRCQGESILLNQYLNFVASLHQFFWTKLTANENNGADFNHNIIQCNLTKLRDGEVFDSTILEELYGRRTRKFTCCEKYELTIHQPTLKFLLHRTTLQEINYLSVFFFLVFLQHWKEIVMKLHLTKYL